MVGAARVTRPGRARGHAAAVALAAAAAVLLLLPAGPAEPALFVEPSGLQLASERPYRGAAEVTAADSRVARAASVVKNKLAKGDKYRGAVNPKLRAVLEAKEYRAVISLMLRMDDEGCLDSFLSRIQEYWEKANIFQMAMEEQQGGSRGVVKTIRKDWPRIWPERMEAERMPGFDTMAAFWTVLDQSRLVDAVIDEVLPDNGKSYDVMMQSTSQMRFMDMDADERQEEILERLGDNDLIKQFAVLSKDDPEVGKLAAKVAPFLATFIATLAIKLANQTDSLGVVADFSVFAIAAVVILVAAFLLGLIKLPEPDEPPPYQRPEVPTTPVVAAAPATSSALEVPQVEAPSPTPSPSA